MNVINSYFLKSSVAIWIAVAIAAAQTLAPARPAAQRTISSRSGPSECEVTQSFASALDDFATQSATLRSKSRVSSAEMQRLQVSANRLKESVQQTLNAAQASVTRQKQAGKWTAEFDAAVEKDLGELTVDAAAKDSLVNWFRQKGGAREAMEDALAKLKLAHVEIDNIVNEIKQKATRAKSNSTLQFRSHAFNSSPVIRDVLACMGWVIVFMIANACGAKKTADRAVKGILENCF